jgi:hypothetical protein
MVNDLRHGRHSQRSNLFKERGLGFDGRDQVGHHVDDLTAKLAVSDCDFFQVVRMVDGQGVGELIDTGVQPNHQRSLFCANGLVQTVGEMIRVLAIHEQKLSLVGRIANRCGLRIVRKTI